jgi:anaerobic ribonucleoside-triphosphate reductase activating protein
MMSGTGPADRLTSGNKEEEPCSTSIRLAGVVGESIVDGPGIRFTIFTQGCKHHCPGCHNPQTHDFDGGKLVTVESILEKIRKNPLLDGITLSGGEPFEQAEACSVLAKAAHAMKLNVMTYSGYTFEEILAGMDVRHGWKELLQETEILVDGRFEPARKNLLLKFRGSSNQRLLDVKKSLREGRAVSAEI